MVSKLLTAALVIIIVCGSAASYIVYNKDVSSNPTPNASPTAQPTSSTQPTVSPTTVSQFTTSPTTTLSATPNSSPTPVPVDLRVFIASSLINVVTNMTKAFEQTNNCHLIVNFAGSSTLYTQITAGAPCDVFMSADQKWNTQLNNSKLNYNNNFTAFTTNSLAVIVAPGNPKGITSLADLTKPGVKVVLGDPSIPAGSYTNSTCWKIDSTWGNPSNPKYISDNSYLNFNSTIHQNVVSYELTVEGVVSKVSMNLGTADAGIVFVSDGVYGSLTGSQVQFISIPAAVNTRGTYGINVMASTTQTDLAIKFMNFWISSQGQALLTQFGFNS
jgi:molybdate transport system substrate-binding protein